MSKRISFVAVAVVLAVVGFYFRAQNSKQAHQSATQITQADTNGVNTTTQIASLKTFVHTHMGASVKFTLTGSYDRAQSAAEAQNTAASSASSALYADAQRACMSHANSIAQADCNTAYIQSHLQSINMTTVPLPKLAAYEYSFASPFWTPDMAGAFFLGAAVALAFSLMMERSAL